MKAEGVQGRTRTDDSDKTLDRSNSGLNEYTL